MTTQPTNIRDLREFKNLSQDKVAEAAGITYSRFVRIEEGSGKTTPEEIASVMAALKAMETGTRKLAGRPFKDVAKQAAVLAARENGTSVAAAIGSPAALAPSPATSKQSAPVATETKPKRTRTPKGDMTAALKTPRTRKPKA